MGYDDFLGAAITTWCRKRQGIALMSTPEYIAVSHGAKRRVQNNLLLTQLMSENVGRRMKSLGDDLNNRYFD